MADRERGAVTQARRILYNGHDSASPTAGPDFLCVGLPKAGTGWLFDQLSRHPQFWIPSVKEFNYLNQKHPTMANSSHKLEKTRDRLAVAEHRRGTKNVRGSIGKERGGARVEKEQRDLAFLEAATACSGQPMDLGVYASLFRFKGGLKSGDISPAYCRLSPETIREFASAFPSAKIILLVRDPVARTWSHISMHMRDGKLREDLLTDPGLLREYLTTRRGLLESSKATRIISHWRNFAPGIRLQYFFFDELVRDPAGTLRNVLLFLGANPNKMGKTKPDRNVKASEKKFEMSRELRDVLVEYLADEVKACAIELGGPARAWPGKYGL